MGACGSVHKESGKLEMSFRSKPNKLSSSIPPSPVKDKLPTTNAGRPINDQWLTSSSPSARSSTATTTFREYGSKDEAFFDSKPWMDSDCESDFYSVNGDFTPSRGNTPVHHNFSQANNTPFGNKSPVPSPPQKKKKLADLFRESFRDGGNNVVDDAMDTTPGSQTLTNGKMEVQNRPTKSLNGTPYASGSEGSAEDATTAETPFKSTQCCLPTFASFRSNSRRRKMSPTVAVVGKA